MPEATLKRQQVRSTNDAHGLKNIPFPSILPQARCFSTAHSAQDRGKRSTRATLSISNGSPEATASIHPSGPPGIRDCSLKKNASPFKLLRRSGFFFLQVGLSSLPTLPFARWALSTFEGSRMRKRGCCCKLCWTILVNRRAVLLRQEQAFLRGNISFHQSRGWKRVIRGDAPQGLDALVAWTSPP